MGTSTSILIRAQARGGKFLGPDIGYSYVTVRDVSTGQILAEGMATGDSGVLTQQAAPPANASNGVVLQGTTPWWLTETSGNPSPTAGFLATFDLDAPALVQITAASIANGVPSQQRTSIRMWIPPGAQLTTPPGLVLEIAGLNVEIIDPNPTVPPQSGQSIPITGWVTMMCGCKISNGTAWPTSEFVVSADIVDSSGTTVASTTLTIPTPNGVPSTYTGSLTCPTASGSYTLIVSAVQASTSNTGGSAWVFSVSS
ncbi:MAG TPA: hypothetical protein VMU84_12255 [Thermoanaerobaculia bacterium]|nr:hypothetical protein [Thermoanaerobaculia bacterium]